MKTFEPFLRYCSAIRHRFSLKMTTRCHSVFSLRSPVVLSFQDSEVASRRFATGRPSWVRRISGSAPRLPIKITLLTLPAMTCSVRSRYHHSSIANLVPDRPAARAIGAPWSLSTHGRYPHMVVIHTASRRSRPKAMFLFCSRTECKENRAIPCRLDFAPSPLEEKGRVLFLGDTF